MSDKEDNETDMIVQDLKVPEELFTGPLAIKRWGW
jgi:hypothetical protein